MKYVRDVDRQEYQKFCDDRLHRFDRTPPSELWHYTNADGLIGILRTGQIWSTQVTCVNDNLEQRYFGDLVHEAVKVRRATNTDPILGVMLRVADEALAQRDFTTASHFVACFSEVEDDLGQWRGYGSGECGYAIGFRSDGILQAIMTRPKSLLLPMNYNDSTHSGLVNEVMDAAERYFRDGLNRGLPDVETWAREFLATFSFEMDIFACLIKHPKFVDEVEQRIATHLQPSERNRLEFRQKRTLLARHLPIDLTLPSSRQLPITRIYVGPGSRPSQHITKSSVDHLLAKFGYSGIPVEMSKVPYRVP